MKIVWLCHFSNAEIKDFFNTPHVMENTPWINNMIEMLQDRTDIELHIVAPNIFTNKEQKVKIKNVQYHFYKHRIIPYFMPEKLHRYLSAETRTNFYFIKRKIARIIDSINPGLIHLHGAESPYYSAGILPIIDCYPTLVTIQGFIRNASERDFITNKRIKIEEEILKRAMHIGVRTQAMSKTVLELNPKAKLHFHNYPITKPTYLKDSNVESTFDIIFYARLCKDKGIEDLLEAVAIIKKKKSDITLHVIGYANKSYLRHLINLAKQLDIETNVKFLGFKPQQYIYKNAINARICVLPTYHDILPGTILESMFMKLPVIAYDVTGLSELNDKGQSLVLVEKNNIQQLADEIVTLLKDKKKRDTLAEAAYIYATERFNNSYAVNEIMKAYNEILSI